MEFYKLGNIFFYKSEDIRDIGTDFDFSGAIKLYNKLYFINIYGKYYF